ncbi:unnamed protein product, partial [Meganyctiphanes norvegica]
MDLLAYFMFYNIYQISRLHPHVITMEHANAISPTEIHLESKEEVYQYQKDGNTEDMFKYLYNQFESQVKLPLKLNISKPCKDELLSNKLREEGNLVYKRKKLQEALEKYNKCILSAPHPKLSCTKVDTNEYNSLAKGYANRSAVLFQLQEYEMCIRDLDRSINLSSSKITQFKLEERKVKCLIAVERYKEAQDILKTCKLMLKSLQLENKDKESYENELSIFLDQCVIGMNKGKRKNKKKNCYEEIKCADASTYFSSDDVIFAYNNPTPPSLDDEPNPTIPAFSRALNLQYSADQGRYVVATRDIKPGEVIAVEKAYTSSAIPEEPNSPFSLCTFCLARCAAPLPCPECPEVVFCNEECRAKGWDKFHMKECPVYSALLELGHSGIGAYRAIIGQSLDELKVLVTQFKREEHISPLKQILNENLVCDSESYRGIYFLEDNMKTADILKFNGNSLTAFTLTQMLIQSNRFFLTETGDPFVPDVEDLTFIGSLLIRHQFGLGTNFFGISEIHLEHNNLFIREVPKGYGTFIAESLFRHSCDPSGIINFHGNVAVCRATRFIPSGSQVHLSYHNTMYLLVPDRAIRRKILWDTYSFMCNCDPCVCDWKRPSETVPTLRVRDTQYLRNDIDNSKSLNLELNTLVTRIQMMQKKISSPNFDINSYLELVLESMDFFDRFIVLPNSMRSSLCAYFFLIFPRTGSCKWASV